MNRLLLLLFTIALCAVQYVYTLSIEIKPGEVDCYYEDLEVGERVTISYEVGDGGNLDIDFWVSCNLWVDI